MSQDFSPGPVLDEKSNHGSTTPTLYDANDQEKPNQQIEGTQNLEEDDGEVYIGGWKLASLMISISLSTFLMLLDMSIITTAIPRITSQFHSLHDIGWYGSAYNLACAALQPLSGKLYTYFKSKWLFLGFILLFNVGSLICAVATSSTMFIIGRAVSGIGGSGIMNGALTMIVVSVPLEKRPSLMGFMMGFSQLGLVIGPLIGGALTEYTTWRWCFYINPPIGGFGALLVLFVHIPDRRTHVDASAFKIITSKLDLTGFAIFVPCTIMFLLALQWGGIDYPWNSATIIGLFCGGTATLLIFIFWEHRVGDGAMIPLPVIRKREIWTACLTAAFLFATVIVASYYLPIYFQSVKGASPFTSGVNLLPSILPQLAAAVISGVLTQKIGYYLPFAVLGAMITAIGNGLLTTLAPHSSTAKWAGFQAIVGIGRGMGMQMGILAIQANTPPALTSVATATLMFSQTFSGSVSISIANVIFSNKLRDELTSRVPHLDVDLIINAGATAVDEVTSKGDLPQVIAAYSKGVDAVFYLAMAASIGMFLSAWGIGFKDIRKKKKPVQETKA